MKTSDKIARIISVILFSALVGVGYANANTVEGTIQGLNCVLKGKICPVDNQDPHIAAESVFVVYSGKDNYKVVANIDRAIMSRHLGKKVKVSGNINNKYNAIDAQSLQVMDSGEYKTVWTMKDEIKEREKTLRGGGGGR